MARGKIYFIAKDILLLLVSLLIKLCKYGKPWLKKLIKNFICARLWKILNLSIPKGFYYLFMQLNFNLSYKFIVFIPIFAINVFYWELSIQYFIFNDRSKQHLNYWNENWKFKISTGFTLSMWKLLMHEFYVYIFLLLLLFLVSNAVIDYSGSQDVSGEKIEEIDGKLDRKKIFTITLFYTKITKLLLSFHA